MTEEHLARERALQHEYRVTADAATAARGAFGGAGIIAWLAVGIPFAIGLYMALTKAAALSGRGHLPPKLGRATRALTRRARYSSPLNDLIPPICATLYASVLRVFD
ncbi:MAG: hypothetical protein WDN03_08515 [Rhizomicrobium sp.]